MDTAAWYRTFAFGETRGYSPTYHEWCTGISQDPQLIGLIDELPTEKRQPNLLLAAARFVGAGTTPYPEFRAFVLQRWPAIRKVMLERRTQTNEAGRCAVLLPLLSRISMEEGRPLALIEVGASAGLCLYPDRYSYAYDDGPLLSPPGVTGAPVLKCTTSGNPPLAASLPQVLFRAGIDLNPLDIHNDDDVAWLEALIWPEHENRRQTLHKAIRIVKADPPRLVRGDLNEEVHRLVDEAPADAAVVVFHTAVLAYVDSPGRETFTQTMRELTADRSRPCHWISNEGSGVMPGVPGALEKAPEEVDKLFVLRHNEQAVARTGGHGQSLHWL